MSARTRTGWALGLVVMSLACSEENPFMVEVIDEVTFAASLGIDLADFTELPSGVWIRDDVVGMGAVIAVGDAATVAYTGWLRSGTQFDSGTYVYDYGVNNMRTPIPGWVVGMEGMAVGGTRMLLIPSGLAYGNQGSGPIPGGAIVIFEVTLDAVS